MDDMDLLAQHFEAGRGHLGAVAYRMLGSRSEAEDAVQEAWLRLSRSGAAGVENLGGWLTTVVARVCLDMLRARRIRREESLDGAGPEPVAGREAGGDAEQEALLAESVGLALLVVLDTLTPAERVAFVLHDMFELPFEEIAPIVGRTPTAARQLASRARRREAFLAASRGGDFEALLALLDPEVVLRADAAAVAAGASPEVRGAAGVASMFSGRARVAVPALIGGAVGLVWAPGGRPRVAFAFTLKGDKVAAIDLVADPELLGRLDPVVLEDRLRGHSTGPGSER